MAKFVFRLQNVLNIKEKIEEQRKIELGNANQYLQQQKKLLQLFVIEKDKYISEFHKKNGKSVKAKDLATLNISIKYFRDKIVEQNNNVISAEEKVNLKREELKQAVVDKKTYEKLREKSYLNYMEELKVEENKIVDEIVSYKYNVGL
jgi:flagellar FliJ protein